MLQIVSQNWGALENAVFAKWVLHTKLPVCIVPEPCVPVKASCVGCSLSNAKTYLHHRFLPKGSICLYRKMFSSGKKKKCEEVHLFMNAIRETVTWLKTRFCMSWDNKAVSSSPYSLDSVAFQLLTSITWETINDGNCHWALILMLFECAKVKQFSIFLLLS